MNFKLLAAAALTLAAFGAQATNVTTYGTPVDDVTPLTAAFLETPTGPFDEVLNFSLAIPGSFASSSVADNLLTVLDVADGSVSLYSGVYGSATTALLSTYSFDGTSGNVSHIVPGALTSGNYYFEVTGEATGTTGAFFLMSATVTPVPEPETYALLLAGLGVVGSLYRRRNKNA